ncbi:MAG TPA: cytochrome c oxidase assembly protein [Terriglobales bacterium]|nr:cytochrome c oxidase assembly protein [Terriglobales bacterium]
MPLSALGWDVEPGVVIGCLILIALYGHLTAWRWRWRGVSFVAGTAIMLLALISPLDILADQYLFSAHMLQHLLLLELAAPLLVLGIPAEPALRWLAVPWLARWERRLRQPMVAWPIGFGTLLVWHVPRLYDWAVASDAVHAAEHVSFVVSAVIFWWPVLAPLATSRLPAHEAVLYLFARLSANLVLGTVIAAAPLGVYAAYAHAPLAQLGWGITPLLDQRLGGFLMWTPSLLVDAAAIPLLLAIWGAQVTTEAA